MERQGFKELVSTSDGAVLAVAGCETFNRKSGCYEQRCRVSVEEWEQSRPTFADLTDEQAERLAHHILDYLACKASAERTA